MNRVTRMYLNGCYTDTFGLGRFGFGMEDFARIIGWWMQQRIQLGRFSSVFLKQCYKCGVECHFSQSFGGVYS